MKGPWALTRVLSRFCLGTTNYLRTNLAKVVELLVREMKELPPLMLVDLRVVSVRRMTVSLICESQ